MRIWCGELMEERRRAKIGARKYKLDQAVGRLWWRIDERVPCVEMIFGKVNASSGSLCSVVDRKTSGRKGLRDRQKLRSYIE